MIAMRKPDWTIADGTLSALKWFAILMMLVDHINLYVLYPKDMHQIELYILGRLAAPIFAVLVGYNLARPDSETTTQLGRTKRMMGWLLCFGVISYPIDLYVGPFKTWEPNILFTFLAGAATVYLIARVRASGGSRWKAGFKYFGIALFFILLGPLGEYGYSVSGTVVIVYLLRTAQSRLGRWVLFFMLLGSFSSFTVENQTIAALLALLPLGLALFMDIKRNLKGPRQFFYWFYPAHQLVLSAVSMLIA